MEVLFIGNLPTPFGGVATHCLNLVKHLADNDVTVHFIETKPRADKTIPAKLSYFQIQTRILPLMCGLFRILAHPSVLLLVLGISIKDALKVLLLVDKAAHILRANPNIKVIHSQHAGTGSLAATLLKAQFSLYLVITAHGAEFTDNALSHKWARVHGHVIRDADKIISVSQYTAGYITDAFPLAESKLQVIPNGVDLEAFVAREEVSRRQEILFVGDFHPRKGIDTLVEAFQRLNVPDWQLHLAGTPGVALPDIERLIAENYLTERVRISLNLSQAELQTAYQTASIFVFPTKSNTEGFGLVALEAMASGLPVIASNIAAIPEIVKDGVTGLLFAPDDPQACAEALRRLVDDMDLRQQLVQNARMELGTKYNWTVVAEKTAAVYAELGVF